MALSTCLAQNFVDFHLNRDTTIDGSLFGMGRIPGNLPIELIADYLNEYTNSNYDIDYLMDAIQDYIAPLKGETEWGYTPAYFLSARFNLHRNYAEHYLKKGDLTHRDIDQILARFDDSKKTAFDAVYADKLYDDYLNNKIDDSNSRAELFELLKNKNILVLAPGSTMVSHLDTINEYIKKNNPFIISVNFIPQTITPNIAFFSNNKRFSNLEKVSCPTILTSNLRKHKGDYVINYNSLRGSFNQGCNSLIMLLNLLKDMKIEKVVLAGADGYKKNSENYHSNNIFSTVVHDNKYNVAVAKVINTLGVETKYITPSEYDIK